MPKPSNNGFATFMVDYRKREERNGRKFRGLDEVVPFAGVEWSKMTPEQKAFYKDKARDYRTSEECRSKIREIRNKPAKPKPAATKVKTCTSSTDESFADDNDAFFYDKDDDDKLFRRREVDRNSLKNALSWNLGVNMEKTIVNESLFVISVQNFYETSEHDYQPAEIAFVEFSLAKGILKQFVAVMKPIAIASAWENWAVCNASQTHHICPLKPPAGARDDYRRIVDEIKRFYVEKQPSNQFRAFALTIQFNSVQGAVKALRDKTGSKLFIPQEKISCVEDLFTLLCGFKNKPVNRNDLIEFGRVLKESIYDYEPNTLCAYHMACHSKHCAMAVAKKICYHLFDRIKDVYGLTLTPNHIPKLPDDVKFNLPKLNEMEEKSVDNEPVDETYAQLVAPIKPVPQPMMTNGVTVFPTPMPMSASNRNIDPSRRLPSPSTLPASLRCLPGFDGWNSKWQRDNENLLNEAAVEAVSTTTSRKTKPKEPRVPIGLSTVKWEAPPVFSKEKRQFINAADVRRNDVRLSPVGFQQTNLSDKTCDNVFDEDDDWEAANFATSSPFDNRSRNSASPVSSIDVDFQATTSNRLNSLGLNQFSPRRQPPSSSLYNLNADGGAVARSMRLPFCKPNLNFLQAPTSYENYY